MHTVSSITNTTFCHLLYSALLIFIFSCSASSVVYPSMPNLNLEVTTKSQQKNYSSRLKKEKRVDGDCPLHQAVCNNEDHWVLLILTQDALAHKGEKDKSGMQVYRKDSQGYIPIYWAVDKKFSYKTGDESNKNIKILKKLLQYYTINQTDQRNKTLLHWAVWNKHLKAVKEILHHLSKKSEKKVFQNFLNQKDRYGYTALHYAVDRDANRKYSEEIDCKILKNILAYSDSEAIHAVDKNGMTALHWAVKNNNLKAVALILEHTKSSLKSQQAYGAFIKAKTLAGCPAIYWTADAACSKGELARAPSLKIFNLLLHALPIDACGINDQDNEGYTMAHWAAVQGRNDILKVLIQHEANCNIQDKKGRTPLHVAIEAAYHVKLKTPSSSRNNYGKDHKIINQLLEGFCRVYNFFLYSSSL